MVKEIVRWLSIGVVLILLGANYWSMVLQEEDLKYMRQEVGELKREIRQLKFKHSSSPLPISKRASQMSEKYPNLLEEDPFFTTTLPALLGDNFIPHGTRREAILGRLESLHPFNGFREVVKLQDMCSVTVAQLQFGKYETMTPHMAIKLEARPIREEPEAEEFWVHLREDVYWQPLNRAHFPKDFTLASHFLKKHPVTAHDFKFYFDAIMNPHISEPKAASLRTYLGEIEEFRVVDDYTFVVRWKRERVKEAGSEEVSKVKFSAKLLTGSLQPLPCFVYQYFPDGKKIIDDEGDPDIYRYHSVWAQNFVHHFAKNIIVSCGPWIFDGMNEEGIKFKRNSDFHNPYIALTEEIHFSFKESYDAIWQDFKAGKIDMCRIAPSQLPELENFYTSSIYQEQKSNSKAIKELDFVDTVYYYIGWNEASPYFESKKVRQAMTMMIDRNRIIHQNLNDMGLMVTGPFFCCSPSYDKEVEPWPYNPYDARRLLEEEGWLDLDGDGIREKSIRGKKVLFRFTLTYYAKNLSTKIICEYIATSLREVGIDCQLNGLDIADLSLAFEDKNFDALYMGWSLGTPPDDPKQLWHSSGAKEKGSSNAVGYADPESDAIIEKLQYVYNPEERSSLYHKFHRIIHEEAPYTFLYSPKARLLYREYIQNLFIPEERQDLVPGADISEPDFRVIWLSN